MSLKLLAMLFGVCGSLMCPVKKKVAPKPGVSSSALVVYKPAVEPDQTDDAAEALSSDDGGAAVGLQAAIQSIGEYATELAQALTDMSNTLGAAQEKSAETIAALGSSSTDLSADVQRASTRLDVVAGTRPE